uniref:Uncharacterized protein n=1 Tax=Haptolina ericina TaxID=156174 RepID=A0A7S3EV83_9EUKA
MAAAMAAAVMAAARVAVREVVALEVAWVAVGGLVVVLVDRVAALAALAARAAKVAKAACQGRRLSVPRWQSTIPTWRKRAICALGSVRTRGERRHALSCGWMELGIVVCEYSGGGARGALVVAPLRQGVGPFRGQGD